MGILSSSEPISLESLSKKIADVRAEADQKLKNMQSQIDTLKQNINEKDLKTQQRIVRLTSLMDNIMTDFQNVIGILSLMSDKISTCEKSDGSLTTSIHKNKQHLNALSKYFKEMNKSWKVAQDEINKLKDASETNTRFHWKIIAGAVFLFVTLVILTKSGNLELFIDFVLHHFGIG